jgi:hypothetical protein
VAALVSHLDPHHGPRFDTVPEPTIEPAQRLRVRAACATRVAKSKVMSRPASASPKARPFNSTMSAPCNFSARHPWIESGVTATGEKAEAGFDWKKPNPLASSPGIRLLSETSLQSITRRIAAAASSRLAPRGTSPVTTAISASKSRPQAASPSGIGSRGPRKPSEPPWYIRGSVQKLSGSSAPRAFRTSATWFT